MVRRKNPKNQTAASFLEYTIILGVVSALLMGMNTYVKRGIQGRLKEMTDYFISNEQLVEVNPTTSESKTVSQATSNNQGFIGGGTRQRQLETRDISAKSSVEYREPIVVAPFTPAEEGKVSLGEVSSVTPPK